MVGPLAGFAPFTVDVEGATVAGRRAGSGAPVLLLHGYPQTGAMWDAVAPLLAERRTVVVPDLRGYGASRCHDDDLTFRAMARDQVRVMADFGFEAFDVVGHDRGARTAHRMALDHPGAVRSLALLDVLPTLAVWAEMDGWLARRYFHWTFLAQPGGLPERLIGADPIAWLHHALGSLGGTEGMGPEALAEYEAAARLPSVVRAWCEDYRAAAGVDLEHDRADQGRLLDHRTLVLWGERGVVGARSDPVASWRAWFPHAAGHSLTAGHFLAEEQPDGVLAALDRHLAG